MVDRRSEQAFDKTEQEGLGEPLLHTDDAEPPAYTSRDPRAGANRPLAAKEIPSTQAQPGSDERQHRRSTSQHSSKSRSGSASDLELDEMRHDDPMYANANGRASEDTIKLDTSRRKWTDWVLDREEPDSGPDYDSKEARRLGSKQFLEKTVINAILIALWYILSISMSVVGYCHHSLYRRI